MILGAILERADPRDALIVAPWRQEKSLDELPADSVIGTSSTRRIAQLKLNYPQFQYKNIRGNMNTRWEKLNNRELGYDAMIAAVAGFQRLNWSDRISEIIEPDRVLYAIGQGALGIECRHNDHDTIRMLSVLNHEPTVVRCIAERAFLRRSTLFFCCCRLFTQNFVRFFLVEGGCSIPNAVRTDYNGKSLSISGILLNLDGSRYVKDHIEIADVSIPLLTPPPTFLLHQTNNDNDEEEEEEGKKGLDQSLYRHFAYICAVNMNETILENAEISGTNLAVKLMQLGAGSILEEIHTKVSSQ